MPSPKLSKLELKIMEALWTKGASSVREIQESFPGETPPRVHDRANDGLPARGEERAQAHEEDRQRAHLRGRDLAERPRNARSSTTCSVSSAAARSR